MGDGGRLRSHVSLVCSMIRRTGADISSVDHGAQASGKDAGAGTSHSFRMDYQWGPSY